jgi:hypothetical protein
MIRNSTLRDLNVIFSKNFVPGSTFSFAQIAQDCGVRLSMPVLPSEMTVDLNEICQKPTRVKILVSPVLETETVDLDEICQAA